MRYAIVAEKKNGLPWSFFVAADNPARALEKAHDACNVFTRTPGIYEVKLLCDDRVLIPWASYAPGMPDAIRHAAARARQPDFPASFEILGKRRRKKRKKPSLVHA